ncbi:MAG TPA: hypothetical protein VFE20_04325, partial [Thermoleophilia bacterium]|nr:hypothetical protein [Thermoleophilia bacterium]
VQRIVRGLGRFFTAVFLTLSAWRVAQYASSTWKSGEVASTTKVPFYPIMFIVAASLLLYAVVELSKVVRFVTGWFEPRAIMDYAPGPDSSSTHGSGWEDDSL